MIPPMQRSQKDQGGMANTGSATTANKVDDMEKTVMSIMRGAGG